MAINIKHTNYKKNTRISAQLISTILNKQYFKKRFLSKIEKVMISIFKCYMNFEYAYINLLQIQETIANHLFCQRTLLLLELSNFDRYIIENMFVKQLPNGVQSMLCASVKINNYKTAVEELVCYISKIQCIR